MAAGLVLGMLVSFARLGSWRPLRAIASLYTDFLRGTPLLVQILWIYYSLPILTGVVFSPFVSAVIALTLNLSAFISEVYRAGIQSIRRVLPPLGSIWVSLFKDTAIVSVIAVSELMYRGKVLSIETYRPVEIYTVVAIIYFLVTYPQARAVDWLFERARVRT